MNLLHRLSPYRPVLWGLSVLGLFGLNGVFVYYALFQPDVLAAALRNPVSLVFIIEAFVMVGFAAWVIARADLKQPGWIAFVVLSIIGGLAFSVPLFLLLHIRNHEALPAPRPGS